MADVIAEQLANIKETTAKIVKGFRFGNKAQLNFLEDLFVLISDGIPANRAIEMLAQVSEGTTREVALSLSDKIGEGQTLADGMQDWFSPNVVEIIRVGEQGGALAQTLESAINMLSQQGVAMGGFIGAVSYPLVVIIAGCFIINYLDKSVFTQFAKIKPVEEWPDAGKDLIGLAKFIRGWWWLVVICIISFILVFKQILVKYTGDFREELDKYPPFTLYRRLVSARFLETLGLLVANGVVFKSAIQVMQLQANPYLMMHLNKMEGLLSKGKSNIADVLDTGLIDSQDLMRLRVMAEVKGFEHGLVRMGIKGTEEATATLNKISKVIGGIFLIMGGILILMIVRGIFMTAMAMGN